MTVRRGCAALLALMLVSMPLTSASALSLPDWLNFSAGAENSGPPRPVVSEIVEGHGEDARSVPGLVQSRTQVEMAFQTLGRMVTRNVDLGDRVQRGEVLAELASEDLEASTRAARAAVDSAEVQNETAQLTLERTRALARRNVATTAQLEQAQNAAAAADAGLRQARSELVQAQDAESYATMVAPFSGVVSAVYEAPGAVVSAGSAVLQLSAGDRREAVIDLPESALVSLPEDASFSIWQRTAPENVIPATLDRIDPMADTATRTRRLYLTLPKDAPFRLGALVRARLGTEFQPVITLPASAVLEEHGVSYVWRVLRQPQGATVEKVQITHMPSFQGRLSVDTGIQPGDEIVTRGIHSLSDGQQVGRRVAP
ncbi:efflux RND transporter periplasmic adaptor subunit [Paracoccus fistulariae]|uniref:Efflux RND transporter periplasmic adaptor subunit n=1 Tax=Paracoccus fistulariae TaxID=658446 RepID=A0ABY7SFI2_9RHOB|nr:efflux RND transporter periplasmic adaptor subunit [Paracoccus fistulariae]MDB6182689.1 efflux RND transporter periplasmic adaptor subunit [Paracoccus fistulariae]WCR05746.1 efflux RND transporter periplasmic adaptor subunit [Paracoccus fistulariae]